MVLRTTSLAVLPLVTVLASSTALAQGSPMVAYLQATGFAKQDAKAPMLQPLNLLDGKSTTAWCSPTSDPLNELIWFGFKEEVSLDALRITTGNAGDTKSFDSFGRVQKVSIRSGSEVRTVELEDIATPQTLSLSPPLVGARFIVEILDQHPSEDISAPVCMSDFLPVSQGRALAGPALQSKLKFDKNSSQLVGAWYAGYDGKPDSFLTFHIDGSFRFAYEPFDGGRNKPKSLTGSYEVNGNRVTLSAAGKKFNSGFVKDAAKGGGLKLSLSGELPPELTKLAFRNRP
jgi:hypothetical protein